MPNPPPGVPSFLNKMDNVMSRGGDLADEFNPYDRTEHDNNDWDK